MSAALQLRTVWAEEIVSGGRRTVREQAASSQDESLPEISLAFYRKHTEKTLQRYLYASMLVGRAPSMLGEPIARGWAPAVRYEPLKMR